MSETHITPERLSAILRMPGAEAIIFNRMKFLDETIKLSYGEIGLLCSAVDSKALWKARCTSFAQWVRLAAPFGYSTAFAAMRDVEELKDMPAEAVANIPASNFPLVKQLSTAVRNDPAMIEAAQTKGSEDLAEYVRDRFPEQHIERRRVLRFTLDESAADRVEAALKTAQLHGAKSWGEALELIAEEAADVWRLEDEVLQAVARMEP